MPSVLRACLAGAQAFQASERVSYFWYVQRERCADEDDAVNAEHDRGGHDRMKRADGDFHAFEARFARIATSVVVDVIEDMSRSLCAARQP